MTRREDIGPVALFFKALLVIPAVIGLPIVTILLIYVAIGNFWQFAKAIWNGTF